MSHIFISYSRKDIDFAQKIVDALAVNNLDTWIDWKSIPKGEDWEQEIYRGIEEADAFLFLISLDSVTSEMCNREIHHAVKNGKRILPIFISRVGNDDVYGISKEFSNAVSKQEINRRNFIFCRDGIDDFAKAMDAIQITIHTDYEWLKFHTRLQNEALLWERNGKEISYLLHEKELKDTANNFVLGSGKEPLPTELQRQYMLTSQINEERLLKKEERRRRQITFGLSLGLIIVTVLGFFAWTQRNVAISETNAKATALVNEKNANATAQAEKERAEEQLRITLARQMAGQAESIFEFDTERQTISGLLAIQSMKMFPTIEASQLLQRITLSRALTVITPGAWIHSVTFGPNGRYIAMALDNNTVHVWETATGKEVTRMIHGGPVTSVAFSPDGKYIISGSDDHTARVWDITTNQEIGRMTHDGPVTSVIFSPHGKCVASGSADFTVRVWEANTGKEISRMTHTTWVTAFAFSPDGKYVASGGGDYIAHIWEANTGKEISRMTHANWVQSIVFSPDGKYIASGSGDATARVWEVSSGQEISRMIHDGPVSSVVFSSDGKYVASGSDDATARVWEVNSGREVSRMTFASPVDAVAFTSDGKYVVAGGCDTPYLAPMVSALPYCPLSTARVWEASTGAELGRIGIQGFVKSVGFSPDEQHILTSTGATSLVWTITSGKEIARVTHGGNINAVAFSPDSMFVVSGSSDKTVRVWESDSGNEVTRWNQNVSILSLAFSPDGDHVLSRSDDNILRLRDTFSGKETAAAVHDDKVLSFDFSGNGKYIASGGRDGIVHVWETDTGKEIARMNHGYSVYAVAFSLDDNHVISASEGSVHVWEASTGKEVSRMMDLNAIFVDVLVDPNRNYVASQDWKSVHIWDAETYNEVARIDYDSNNLISEGFVLSSDGKYMAMSGCETTQLGGWICVRDSVRVWEISTGKELARLIHNELVTSVAFSPDGNYVVTGSSDNSARVWEISSGKEIARMTHSGSVVAATFSPNGKYVVSSGDTTARVWIWRPDDLVAETCSRIARNFTRAEWAQYIGDALPYQAVCPNLPIEPEVIITPTP